ncbi:MAG: 6-phosphogluconolactonase, partial [Verrucomicrobiota bacterium]
MMAQYPVHFTVDRVPVQVHETREGAGAAAAMRAARALRETIARKGAARILLASAPSQDEMLMELTAAGGIDWSRVTAFHMDEYVGLGPDHPASFRNYLQQHFLSRVRPAAFHAIQGGVQDPEAECRRYAALLAEAPIDLACMGIGENGHIAFNDPSEADFEDPQAVKVVELDKACREQQIHDGLFSDIVS